MTTDAFTTAARAEAKRYFLDGPVTPEPQKLGEHMAEWARDHLAAQEPTDAEVRAVVESYEPGLFSLSDHLYGIRFDNDVKYRRTHQELSIADAEAALSAARNAR